MKVFVTGGTGFIGKHLVRRLILEGHQVTCLARNSLRGKVLEEMGARVVAGNVNDPSALRAGMAGCDWLFHLANLYSMWEPDAAVFQRVNVDGTRLVLETALETGVQKVVYVSTVAVFGKPAEIPFDEQSYPGPQLFSAYSRSKSAAEQIAWDLYQRRGLPLVVLYPGIVLGQGDDKASGQYIRDIVFRRLPSTIFHDSVSTYVYVGDVVSALVQAAQRSETVGQKYLVGRSQLSGQDFARLVSEVSGVPLPLFHFPDWMVIAAAYLLSGVAALTGAPPWWGLSVDAAWTLRHGFRFSGAKAERELGIRYTPIRAALQEAVSGYLQKRQRRRPAGKEPRTQPRPRSGETD